MTQKYASYITHYYLADRKPFLNLGDLKGKRLRRVLDDLESKRSDNYECGKVFDGRYMEIRRKTESRLRELFVDAGLSILPAVRVY